MKFELKTGFILLELLFNPRDTKAQRNPFLMLKLVSYLSFQFVSFLFDKTAYTAVNREFETYAFHSFENFSNSLFLFPKTAVPQSTAD